jgi:8-oxo-dGTP diphosphatase
VGHWNLPGGGIDHGETPHDALHRELYEETGLVASSARLVDVHSVHEIEPVRDDGYDDYHGIHIIFAVDVDPGAALIVIDEGGSTDLAKWVSFDDARTLPLLPVVQHVLDSLDAYLPA